MSGKQPRVLFVCVENANRSQMAQGFARLLGEGRVEAQSAGSSPSGKVNPRAVRAMGELGYDLTRHHSKSLSSVGGEAFDVVVTMGCGDRCAGIVTERLEDWEIPDPRDLSEQGFRAVRDTIGRRVAALISDLDPRVSKR